MNSKLRTRALWFNLLLRFLVISLLLILAVEAIGQKDAYVRPLKSNKFLNTLSKQERAWLRDHPVIRVAQDPNWPPIEFNNELGEPSGMSADHLKLIEQRLGVKFEWIKNLSWQQAYTRLKRWDIDMTTCVAMTPERTKFWAFTKPYLTIPIVIATQLDVAYIADMHELVGKKVAVVDGYAVNDWMKRDYPEIQQVRVKTALKGLELLQRGEVFAYIDNLLVIGHYQAKMKISNIKIAGQTPYVNAQCMAVRKDWAPLAGILQKTLKSISETERNNIHNKWLPIRYENGFNYTLFREALLIFAAILLVLVAWNRGLAREIKRRKLAESALQDSRNIIESSLVVIFLWKNVECWPVESVSKNVETLYGYTDQEFISGSIDYSKVIHPEDLDRVVGEVINYSSEKLRTTFVHKPYRIITKDGQVKWVDDRTSIRRDDRGEITHYHGIIIDITERKQLEEDLRESEATVRKKLETILEPEGDIGSLSLTDIIDQKMLQTMMEEFYRLTKLGTAVVDVISGKVVVATGWQDICIKFHRVNPDTLKNCLESDIILAGGVLAGQFKDYRCKNNLWDLVTPIEVGGRHLGNIYIGQFFYEDEPPDYELFRSQARQYGFDEAEYIAALDRVPRWSHETVNAAMVFFAKLSGMISSLSYSTVKLARTISQKDMALHQLVESEERMRSLITSMNDLVFVMDNELVFQEYYHPFTDALYVKPEQFIGKHFDAIGFPEPACTIMKNALIQTLQTGNPTKAEYYLDIQNVQSWFDLRITPLQGRDGTPIFLTCVVRDITERKHLEEALTRAAERDRHIADVLQQTLIPSYKPMQPVGYEIATRYQSALLEAEVCGDFYDLFDLGDGKLGIVIGDIVGKGLHAAARVSAVRHTIRSYAYVNDSPSIVMTLVNDAILRDIVTENDMLTAFFAILDTRAGELTYTRAGHEPPLLMHTDGLVEYLMVGGPMLSGMCKQVYLECKIKLHTGEALILVTDGITEARKDGNQELFGEGSFERCLFENVGVSAEDIATRVLEDAVLFANGALRDDVAMIVVKKVNEVKL